MTRDRHTGLCTWHLRTRDGWYVYAIEPHKVTTGGDCNVAAMYLREPERVDAWVADVQKLIPSVTLRAERAR